MDVGFFLCGFHELGEIQAYKVWLFEINGFHCETSNTRKSIKIEQKDGVKESSNVYSSNITDQDLLSRKVNMNFSENQSDVSK